MSLTPKILSFAVMMALGGAAAAANTNSPAVGRALGLLQSNGAAARASVNDQFVARDVIVDADGTEHVRFNRTYAGLPVIGGDIVVHSRGGQFKSASLTQAAPLNVNTHANVPAADAIVNAGAEFGSNFIGVPNSSLVVYARDKGAAKLAWQVGFQGNDRNGNPVDSVYIVDANNGKVLDRWSTIETVRPGSGSTCSSPAAAVGSGSTLYSGAVTLNTTSCGGGTSFQLKDSTRGGGYTTNMGNSTSGSGTIFSGTNNVWGSGVASDVESAAADAHFGIAATWDYYKNILGRTGIDGAGTGALSKVHYGRNYVNAFWSDSCYCMTFGDGDGVTYGPLVNLDVAGHEMSHGVTSRTAALTYSGESGGLNESNSDIFGTMVEFYVNSPNDVPDYLIGEELYISNPGNAKAFRYMYHPSLEGASASRDCWSSTLGSLD
ncbi:MAG: M4 family metallopeptidase, partial [Arenimonas sp.]